jgi:hypothetical protein
MKHKLNLTQLAGILLIFSVVFFISCQKENSQSGTPQQQEEASMVSSESDAEAEVIFNSVFDDAIGANDDVGLAGTGVFWNRATTGGTGEVNRTDTLNPVTRCFTVTIIRPTPNPFPVKIIIDFGTTGCPGPDGHVRKGKIITEYTNRLIIPGAVATTVFENFYIDAIKVEGTHKITNTRSTTSPAHQFKVEVINGKLSKPNGNFVEWNSTKTITQIEGILTPLLPRDDVFRIEGHSHGRVKRENLVVAWESSITEPLIKRFTCRWLVRGRIKTVRINVTANSPWVAILDFGNGDCDNKAVITINGVSHQITLP